MPVTLFSPLLLSAVLFLGANKPKEAPKPTAERSAGKMRLLIYPVADLVVPIGQAGSEDRAAHGELVNKLLNAIPDLEVAAGPAGRTTEARLIKLICTTVEPGSWAGAGGPGRIDFQPPGLGLVVYNTPAVQEQVADLLAALRRLLDVEVSVEVRLVSVPEALVERLGVDFDGQRDPAPAGQAPGAGCNAPDQGGMAFLSDEQVRGLLAAAQGDRRNSALQSPRLTVLNGQAATVDTTQKVFFVTDLKVEREGDNVVVVPKNEAFPTGFRFTVRPVVSADRRTVLVNLQADLTELSGASVPVMPVTTHLVAGVDPDGKERVLPVQQLVQQPSFQTWKADKCFRVADGQTAVLRWGSRVVEGRSEWGPPVLSQMPYLGRLFRNVGYARDSQTLLLLVTPRIIVQEEQEQIFLGNLPPLPRP